VKTFAELFSAAQRCSADSFEERVFWRCLHRRALPAAPIVRWLSPGYFAPDWEFVRASAHCSTLRQIDEEIRDFTLDSANHQWWRRVARFRISTRRLRRLARLHLQPKVAPHANPAGPLPS
jgi:hypothetical protein